MGNWLVVSPSSTRSVDDSPVLLGASVTSFAEIHKFFVRVQGVAEDLKAKI